MKIKNLKVMKKLKSIALVGSLSAVLISGCGPTNNNETKKEKDLITIKTTTETTETNPKVDMLIIFGENTATLIEIDLRYTDDRYETKGGILIQGILTDNYRFLKDITYEQAEELARDVIGEDVKINYFDCEPPKTLKRQK